MNPEQISDEYAFKLAENYTPPEVDTEPYQIPYYDLPSQTNCGGLFISDLNITDLMHSDLTAIYINETESREELDKIECIDGEPLVISDYNTAIIKDNETLREMISQKIGESLRLVHVDEVEKNPAL